MQRRDTAVTGGCSRRLSLMHMVVKGSWDRSSLGTSGGSTMSLSHMARVTPGDISPFNVCRVPPSQELLDFLATPLLVLRVAGQVVEEPRQATGRGVVACGDIG